MKKNILFFDPEIFLFYKKEFKEHNMTRSNCNNTVIKDISRGIYDIIFFNLENEKEIALLKTIDNIINFKIKKIGIRKTAKSHGVSEYQLDLHHIQDLVKIKKDLIRGEIKSFKKHYIIDYKISVFNLSRIKNIVQESFYLSTSIIGFDKEKTFIVYNSLMNNSFQKYCLHKDKKGVLIRNKFANTNIISFSKKNSLNFKSRIQKRVIVYSTKGFVGNLPYEHVEYYSEVNKFIERIQEQDFDFCLFEFSSSNKLLQKNLSWKINDINIGSNIKFFNSKSTFIKDKSLIFFKADISTYIKNNSRITSDNVVLIKDEVELKMLAINEIMFSSKNLNYDVNALFKIKKPFDALLRVNNIKYLNNKKHYYCSIEDLSSDEEIKLIDFLENI
jgi:hypothetical protein